MNSSPGRGSEAIDASAVVFEMLRELSPLGVTEIPSDAELVAELGFDSLGLVELLVALEDALDLPPIDPEGIGEMNSVADLERLVLEARAA